MAVTIVRTSWIDDDGTGTTGTVINNAVKTALYNDIDGALAKVAQLAGGNAFTGTQTVSALNSAAFLPFLTANAERVRITATGELLINSAVNAGSAHLLIVTDQAHTGFLIQNMNPANAMTLQYFMNSAGGGCGSITQTGATSCAFNTGSDARLKDDAGRANDVAALRAVVIHDFAWKADGVRDRGVFAQEAHALFPRAVTPGDDETTDDGSLAHPWQTDYSKFVPDLIVGWQQHDADLAELRAAFATLAAEKGL
jgi:hypothetical protein